MFRDIVKIVGSPKCYYHENKRDNSKVEGDQAFSYSILVGVINFYFWLVITSVLFDWGLFILESIMN